MTVLHPKKIAAIINKSSIFDRQSFPFISFNFWVAAVYNILARNKSRRKIIELAELTMSKNRIHPTHGSLECWQCAAVFYRQVFWADVVRQSLFEVIAHDVEVFFG